MGQVDQAGLGVQAQDHALHDAHVGVAATEVRQDGDDVGTHRGTFAASGRGPSWRRACALASPAVECGARRPRWLAGPVSR